MSDVSRKRSKMPALKKPEPPAPIEPPVPLDNNKLFSKPKAQEPAPEVQEAREEPIKINIEEKTAPPLEAAPAVKPKKPRKKRKPLSAEHKAKLAAGRLKGLETRRKKAAERKAKAMELAGFKEQKRLDKITKPLLNEKKRTEKLVQQIKKNPPRAAPRPTAQASSSGGGDMNFEKFFGYMQKYKCYISAVARTKKLTKSGV